MAGIFVLVSLQGTFETKLEYCHATSRRQAIASFRRDRHNRYLPFPSNFTVRPGTVDDTRYLRLAG